MREKNQWDGFYKLLKAKQKNKDLSFVTELSKLFNHFYLDNSRMLDYLSFIDKDIITEQLKLYWEDEIKVRNIRKKILEKLKKSWNISFSFLEKIKIEEEKKFEKNILKSWKNYNILSSIVYYEFKNSVETSIKKFIEELELKLNIKWKVNSKFVWFEGSTNFWQTRTWIAFYDINAETHQWEKQLFIDINYPKIEYWLNEHDWNNNKLKNIDLYEPLDVEDTKKKIIEEFIRFKDKISTTKRNNIYEYELEEDEIKVIKKFIWDDIIKSTKSLSVKFIYTFSIWSMIILLIVVFNSYLFHKWTSISFNDFKESFLWKWVYLFFVEFLLMYMAYFFFDLSKKYLKIMEIYKSYELLFKMEKRSSLEIKDDIEFRKKNIERLFGIDDIVKWIFDSKDNMNWKNLPVKTLGKLIDKTK